MRRRRLVSNARALKVFSLWNSAVIDPTAAATPALVEHENLDCEELPGLLVPEWMEGDGEHPPGRADGPLSFIVNLWALEVIREDASSALNPLTRQQIFDRVLAGDPGAHRGSRYKAELVFGSQNVRRVDFGQSIRMSAVARYMNVAALFPAGSLIEPEATKTQGPGLVIDTIFGVEILASYAPPGNRLATNSSTTVVAAAAANDVIRLEPGCRKVTVIQTAAGPVMTPSFALDDIGAAAGPLLGVIVLGGDRIAQDVEVPGHAQVILTGPAAAAARVVTVIQHLEI